MISLNPHKPEHPSPYRRVVIRERLCGLRVVSFEDRDTDERWLMGAAHEDHIPGRKLIFQILKVFAHEPRLFLGGGCRHIGTARLDEEDELLPFHSANLPGIDPREVGPVNGSAGCMIVCVTDISPDNATIKLRGEFGGFTPADLFDHWVQPELLTKWWPREAKVDPRVGGEYVFAWPDQNWRLSGVYTAFEPGKHLGFTWKWDHDVDQQTPLQVDLVFEEVDDGTVLTVDHGRWGDTPAEQDERKGVIEGWIHFGMRLAGLHQGEAT